jgi:stage II sporulation protein AA (anti-sigma F factor antagonist)
MTEDAGGPLKIVTDRQAETLQVVLCGELDLHGSRDFRALLATLPGSPPVASVVFDVKALDYVDSVGIGLLVSARQRIAAAGGTMSMVNAGPATRRVFAIAGLTDYLGLVD